MRQRVLAFGISVVALAAVALAAGLAVPAAGGNGPLCVLNTKMVPEEEAPHISTSEAKGQAHIKLFEDGTVEWKVHILNRAEEAFRAGHIHRGAFGVAGPVVIGLFNNPAGTTDRQFRDRGELGASATLVAEICAFPERFYVNYHTADNPGGAVRGQLG